MASKRRLSACKVRARSSLARRAPSFSCASRSALILLSRNTRTAFAMAAISLRCPTAGISTSIIPAASCSITAVICRIGRTMLRPITTARINPTTINNAEAVYSSCRAEWIVSIMPPTVLSCCSVAAYRIWLVASSKAFAAPFLSAVTLANLLVAVINPASAFS